MWPTRRPALGSEPVPAELRFVSVVAFVVASLYASRGDAFCRTTTVHSPGDLDAVSDGCWNSGIPLYHPSQCLAYRLTKESPVIPNAVLSDTFARAFAAWTARNPTCAPGITPIELPPSAEPLVVDYQVGQPAQNLIGVRADWPYGNALLALSTLHFKIDTGEVLDVDVEINGTADWSFDGTPPAGKVDLLSALTHEAGHMLGFAHSDVKESAMNPTAISGSVAQRTVTGDDQAAICVAYPNRSQRLASAGLVVASSNCNLATGNPDGTCANPEISHGCSIHSVDGAGTIDAGLLLALGAIAARRRARLGKHFDAGVAHPRRRAIPADA